MTFIEQAKTILSEAEMAQLHALSAKAANFESNGEEDRQLGALKSKVHTAISDQERLTALAFLKNTTFSPADVLKVAGYTRKEVMQAVGQLFPREATKASDAIAVYPSGEYKDGERISQELKSEIQNGGVAQFVTNLTDFGSAYLKECRTSTKGPSAGKPSYANLTATAKRLGFPFDGIKSALGI